MSHRGSKFGDFVTGLLVGGTIGYLYALLSAPRTGEETRHMLEEKGMELRERAKDTVQTTVDKTNKMVAEGRERIESTAQMARERIREESSEAKDRSTNKVDEVRSQVSDTMRRAADEVDPHTPGSTT